MNFQTWLEGQFASRPAWDNTVLAKAVGVSASAVSLWRTGKSKPKAQTLYKLAGVTGADPDFLIRITHGGPPEQGDKPAPASDELDELLPTLTAEERAAAAEFIAILRRRRG